MVNVTRHSPVLQPCREVPEIQMRNVRAVRTKNNLDVHRPLPWPRATRRAGLRGRAEATRARRAKAAATNLSDRRSRRHEAYRRDARYEPRRGALHASRESWTGCKKTPRDEKAR